MSQNLIDILTGVGVRDPFWRHRGSSEYLAASNPHR